VQVEFLNAGHADCLSCRSQKVSVTGGCQEGAVIRKAGSLSLGMSREIAGAVGQCP
jgi:hypothetical protein